MDNITHKLISDYNFEKVLVKLLAPNDSISAFPKQCVSHSLAILGLTSGLNFRTLSKLRWRDVLSIQSSGNAKVHQYLSTRKTVLISPKIGDALATFYHHLKLPSLEARIIDSLPNESDKDSVDYSLLLAIGLMNIKGVEKEQLYTYRNPDLPQVLFGRQILKVCGYSNGISKFLKVHFGFTKNNELFDFLGYKSLDNIQYSIHDIPLMSNKIHYKLYTPRSFLADDKNFNIHIDKSRRSYPFMYYPIFYNFLNQAAYEAKTELHQSVVSLILLGMITGKRLSKHLEVNWSDLVIVDTTSKKLSLPSDFNWNGSVYQLPQPVLNRITNLFKSHELEHIDDQTFSYKRNKDLKVLEKPVFTTNRGKRLTQNSLLRETKATLHHLGFKHYRKFTTKSTQIMFGRRIIEIKGNHKPTIRGLKTHFNFKTTKELMNFLYIDSIGDDKSDTFGNPFEHFLFSI